MVIYLICFFLSISLIILSEKVVAGQRKIVVFAALILPCLLAGFRASTIGTDVKGYLEHMTDIAINSSGFRDYLQSGWSTSWRVRYISDFEVGFSVVVYIVATITKSLHAVQFVIQVLIIWPVYCAIKNINDVRDSEDRLPVWLALLVFYLMMYNTTLNLMRQGIAMAFIFLAYSYLLKNDNKKCILFTIIAVLFHTSSLIGVGIFVIEKYVETDKSKFEIPGISNKFRNMIIVLIGASLLFLGINTITTLLRNAGFTRYLGYISGELTFLPNQIIARLPVIILIIILWRQMKCNGTHIRFLFTMLFIDILCSQFSSVNSFGGRISLYFIQFEMVLFPTMYITSKKSKIILAAIILYMLFYWWFYFVYKGANATVPYIFGN